MHYSFKGINSALVGMSQELLEKGVWRKTPGFQSENSNRCKELPFPVIIEIENPESRHVVIPERKWNSLLPYAESLWLALGSNDLDYLPGKYVKSLYNFSDDGRTWRACFTGDTKIKLLDGTVRSLKSLEKEKEFWVYSKDSEGRVVPGKGHSARKTKTVSKLLEIELDNGEVIKCTPDHLFLLKNGSYKEAQNLTEKDSLSPLYFREAETFGYKGDGYLEVQDDVGSWSLVHRRVGEFIDNQISKDKKPQLHHKDYNKRNNSPDNLVWMSNVEHRRLHAKDARVFVEEKRKKDPSFNNFLNEISIRNLEKANEKTKELLSSSEGDYIREVRSENMKKLNSGEYAEKQIDGRYLRVLERIVESGNLITEESYKKFRNPKAGVPTWEKFLERFGSIDKAISIMQERYNHKIVSKRMIKETTDVYDISVDKYHNFALDAGVFVHNSYGPRIRYYNGESKQYPLITKTSVKSGIDQLQYCVETLQAEPNSRQALITIHDPNKDSFVDLDTKDQPCTRSIHFMKDPKTDSLNCYVHMRSNDILFGFSAINVFNFTWMQEYVAYLLGWKVGKYYHMVDNFHYYERFEEKIEALSKIDPVEARNHDMGQSVHWINRKNRDTNKELTYNQFLDVLSFLKDVEEDSLKSNLYRFETLMNLPFQFRMWGLRFFIRNAKEPTLDKLLKTYPNYIDTLKMLRIVKEEI